MILITYRSLYWVNFSRPSAHIIREEMDNSFVLFLCILLKYEVVCLNLLYMLLEIFNKLLLAPYKA